MHPERMESELFGSESAWDGPVASAKVGILERAHGGTLLLDEVADMPLETQGKIVRVLQEQTFLRVGGNRRVEVDVRVLASTNRDLMTMITEGQFREDLYYRLNVVPIRVPALRERREDIPELIEYFMEHAAQMAGLPPRRLSDDGVAALQAYDWPGNVRQLRNVVDWILIMAPGETDQPVSASMLPTDIGDIAPVIARPEAAQEVMALPLREAREVFERQYLEAQISRFGGNISRTAGFVGMERSALHRKLRTLGIAPGERH
jgi:two-component system nitrogen regulation response regulator NtrX